MNWVDTTLPKGNCISFIEDTRKLVYDWLFHFGESICLKKQRVNLQLSMKLNFTSRKTQSLTEINY